MEIGILGGSFDPIHNGHLHMAKKALAEYALDEVWLMPAGHSPNKDEAHMASAFHRRNMCELACIDEEKIRTSPLETDSAEKSYTYRTLQKLTAVNPQDHFSFIMGADSLAYFDCWVHPEIICQLADILVVNRGEYTIRQLEEMAASLTRRFPASIRFVHCEKYVVSSRTIRSMIRSKADVSAYLPEKVLNYINAGRLYREG